MSQAWLKDTREHAGLLQGRVGKLVQSALQLGRWIKNSVQSHATQCCMVLEINRGDALQSATNSHQHTKRVLFQNVEELLYHCVSKQCFKLETLPTNNYKHALWLLKGHLFKKIMKHELWQVNEVTFSWSWFFHLPCMS